MPVGRGQLREDENEIIRLREILAKQGVCYDCGHMYDHEYDAPFASCGCGTSEWYHFTPYMKAVLRVKQLEDQLEKLAPQDSEYVERTIDLSSVVNMTTMQRGIDMREQFYPTSIRAPVHVTLGEQRVTPQFLIGFFDNGAELLRDDLPVTFDRDVSTVWSVARQFAETRKDLNSLNQQRSGDHE